MNTITMLASHYLHIVASPKDDKEFMKDAILKKLHDFIKAKIDKKEDIDKQ